MDDIGQLYGLKSIELSDKPSFDEAFRSLKEPLSDYTFANTFIWRAGLRLYWERIEEHLCVFANGTGDLTMLMPPLGEGNLNRCIHRCFEIMDDYNERVADRSHSRIEYVSDELLERLRPLGMAEALMGGDYVYDTTRMIALSGGDLKSKRQARGKFLREHDVRTEPLTPEHAEACRSLLRSWQAHGDAGTVTEDPLSKETTVLRGRDAMATELALQVSDKLGLTGMALWADDRLVGFTLGEPLNSSQASIVVEKTDLSVYGSAQYIFSEFCRHWSSYPECNVGDDWGIPSLRWTKESYRPIRLLSKYVVTVSPTPMVGWAPSPKEALPELRATNGLSPANPRHMTSAGVPGESLSDERIRVQPATVRDMDALAALEANVFGKDLAVNRRQIRYLLHSNRALVVVARLGEHIAGWAIALLRKHKKYESARIYSLAVDPAHRGCGVGERLAVYILRRIEELGVRRCFLEVAEDNAPAKCLYERLGFVVVATLPNYYGERRHGWRMLRVSRRAVESHPALPRPLGLV